MIIIGLKTKICGFNVCIIYVHIAISDKSVHIEKLKINAIFITCNFSITNVIYFSMIVNISCDIRKLKINTNLP